MSIPGSQSQSFRGAIPLLAIALLALTDSGCRTLQNRLPDNRLVRGRQLSSRGAELLRRERVADAETLFCEAIEHCSTDERAHWGYAMTLWRNHQQASAVSHMREAVRLSGNNPEYMIELGEMYLALNDIDAAELQARNVLKNNRNYAKAWALLGNAEFQRSHWDQALESYHRALHLQPDYAQVQLAIAETYRNLGRPSRALATLDRMIDVHPVQCATGETQVMRATALIELGRFDEARQALKAVGDSLPIEKPARQLQVVQSYCELGDLVEARMALGRILQHHPSNVDALAFQQRLDISFETLADSGQRIER